MTVAGLILAGGRSSRMAGADKTLMPLAGKPLVRHVLERLAPQASPIAINTNAAAALFSGFGVAVIGDTIAGFQGPLAGVLAGLEWAPPGATHVFSVAADTPFFPLDLRQRLELGAKPGRITVAASGGRIHPTFALWPVGLRQELARFLESGDTRRVMTFIEQAGMDVVEFPTQRVGRTAVDPFFNINRREDLAAAEDMLGGAD
ncbi:molybdenum cofactor guanylyltransferase MobA [Aminobacter sp. HY435]|uniref:molybdenum cofactor guanylyltransferase MobA n=1 Tax=Aminobacter sp. HY435 TaxID=2970917 RepID=UPI0022B9AF22|nr:molybdenum cofactor guanylyltransferase MobA [Aminobacter sp. HY435]